MSTEDKFRMTFSPRTIEALGIRLYSSVPPVVAELISNSYDADATKVTVHLNDSDSNNKEIIVEDNGHGMTASDINGKFLRIGRNRRANNTDKEQTSPSGRLVIGKKGLGKLSFFGIAQKIIVSTTANSIRNTLELDWADIISKEEDEKQTADYAPRVVEYNVKDTKRKNGTTITLKIKNKTNTFNADRLAVSLSKFLIIDDTLDIFVQHNQESPIRVANEMRYDSLNVEFEWTIPSSLDSFENNYKRKDKVIGRIYSTKKPISPSTQMRGITLFSRKKLINLPEYFSDNTSSHFYSYLTGWLEVDFIDTLTEDVIGTSRQSLDWSNPDMEELRTYLQQLIRFIEKEWRDKRRASQEKELSEKTGINIAEWKEKVPEEVNKDLTPIIESLRKNAELPEEQEQILGSMKNLRNLVPEYTYLHWRHFHPTLKKTVSEHYHKKEYYTAVSEGMKQYITEVQLKTGSTLTDGALLESIFALNPDDTPKKWSVIEKYKRSGGQDFPVETKKNITKGHRKLVLAMWETFRCPMSHSPTLAEFRDSGLYTEKDCLDALSLLSHLFRRLDDIQDVTPGTP